MMRYFVYITRDNMLETPCRTIRDEFRWVGKIFKIVLLSYFVTDVYHKKQYTSTGQY